MQAEKPASKKAPGAPAAFWKAAGQAWGIFSAGMELHRNVGFQSGSMGIYTLSVVSNHTRGGGVTLMSRLLAKLSMLLAVTGKYAAYGPVRARLSDGSSSISCAKATIF